MNNFLYTLTVILLLTLSRCPLYAEDLPTLEQIKNKPNTPVKIQPTGKREALEPMVDSKIHGKARYYHPNGQLYGVIEWKDGKKVGTHVLYREDGSFEQMLSYEDGVVEGPQIWGNPDGTLKEYAIYRNGKATLLYEGGVPHSTSRCSSGISFDEFKSIPYPIHYALRRCQGQEPGLPKPSFDCSLAKSEAEKQICSNKKWADDDVEINKTYSELQKILDKHKSAKLKAKQLAWIKERNTCLEMSPSQRSKNPTCFDILPNRVHDLKIELAEAKLPQGDPNEAAKTIKEIEGQYCEPEVHSLVNQTNGEDMEDTFIDELRIQNTDDSGAISFSTTIYGENVHTCGLKGRAVYTGNGEFMYSEGDDEKACRLAIIKTQDGLAIEDRGQCKDYCGVRASFGDEFRFANRLELKAGADCPAGFKSKSSEPRHRPTKKKKEKK